MIPLLVCVDFLLENWLEIPEQEKYKVLKTLQVHAHDPTVSFPPNRGKDEHFHKLGVAVERCSRENTHECRKNEI